jgi:hypothetical protein
MHKNSYIVPQCDMVNVQPCLLMAASIDSIPVDPDTPAIPAAREEHDSRKNIWENEW